MRVIAGKFRSRRLQSIRGADIRPTSDRLRETLFDVLTAGSPDALAGSVWLDLFAGTGAVGIEAVSRGAELVYFVDSSKSAIELINKNLQSLGISAGFRTLQQDAQHSIGELERQQIRPDFIFLDPPYRMHELSQQTLQRVAQAEVSVNALIILEHERRFDPGEEVSSLRRVRKLKQGDTGLSFYRRA